MANKWNNFQSSNGIGDYIHLRKQNYLYYGINRNFGNSITAASAAMQTYNSFKNIISKTITKGKVQDIEQYLNALMHQNYNNSIFQQYGIDTTNAANLENELSNAVEQQFGNKGIYQFERETLGLSGGGLQNMGQLAYSGIKGKTQSIRASTLAKISGQVDKAVRELSNIIKRGVTKSITTSALQQLREKKLELQKLRVVLNNAAAAMWSSGRKSIAFKSDTGLNDLGACLLRLNQLSKAIGTPTKEELGTTAELFGGYAGLVAAGKANQITAKTIQNTLTGGKKAGSHSIIEVGAFVDAKELLNELNKNVVGGESAHWSLSPDGEKIISGTVSQDTVDVRVEYEDDNNIFGTKSFSASIKSYLDPLNTLNTTNNYLNGVGVLSGAPLLSILQLTTVDFANHYLNLLAHTQGKTPSYVENTVKQAVAVRAIVGARNNNFNNLSQYFILNSRVEKRIRVFTSADLLSRLIPGFGLFNDNYANVKGLPDKIINTREDTVEQRISKILAQMHKFKISMSLDSSVF